MSLLQKVVRLLTEAAYKPGIMSLVGIKRERECAADLKRYFDQLWKEIGPLGLGGIAKAAHKEAAVQTAELEIRRALRQANPLLIHVLSGHIYLALLDGDKVARRQMKQEFKEASPVPPPPEPPTLFQTILRMIDTIGITGHEAADYAARRAASQVKGINDTTLSILRGSIQRGIEDQLGVDGLGRLIRSDFEDMSVRRAKTIASTEMNDAFSEAAVRNMKRLGVEYKQLIIAPGACEICQSIADAGPVPVDEPFVSDEGEEFDRTPIHPNCLTGDALVAASGVTAEFVRRFEGEVVVIRCAGVSEIAITPNHPVLTDGGWVAAGQIKKGMNLAHCLRPGFIVAASTPDDHLVPTRFEEVADTLRESGFVPSSPVPTSAEDFHGDGVADSEVDIVRPARLLMSERDSARLEDCGESGFSFGHRRGMQFARSRAANEFSFGSDATTNGSMSGLGECAPVGGAGVCHADTHGVGIITDQEPGAFESSADSGTMTPDAPGEIYRRLAGEITFVKVVDVEIRKFGGHVYNLETKDRFYYANGLIVHNCGCATVGARPPVEQ